MNGIDFNSNVKYLLVYLSVGIIARKGTLYGKDA